jgi:co-chaperonin GroES (HSP10)
MIRPLGDNLVLEVLNAPGKVGGLYMPDTGRLSEATGVYCRVLGRGPKCKDVVVGDTVHLKAYGQHPAGIEIKHEDKNLVMIRERDINGIVSGYTPPKEPEFKGTAAWGMAGKVAELSDTHGD